METPGPRKQQQQDQLARMAVLLLVSSLCCPLRAQDTDDYITSQTTVFTPDTRVVISAPYAVISKSMYVFTTGIPIQPVYIQAPGGMYVWLSIQCKGGAARVTLPDYVANYSMVQTDPTGEWIRSPVPDNATATVTGLGIKFNQNVSVANDALDTLVYGKGADNDIAGRATMTITMNWNVTIPKFNGSFIFTRSKRIYIWAPTALTSLSTYQATVAAVCIVGIFAICCLGCLNTVAISSLRRYNVLMARETRDQQECEQNRVFNPLWMPCAPSQPGYYNIESTMSPLMLVKRRLELKNQILRMPTPFSLQDRLMRVRHLKSSNYWFGCRLPCASAPQLRDSSRDDDEPATQKKVAPARQDSGPAYCVSCPPAAAPRVLRESQFQTNVAHSATKYTVRRAEQSAAVYTQNSTQPRPQPRPHYPQQTTARNWAQAQAQAQATMFNNNPQSRMYSGAASQGNRRNYETITVGFALIHHMLRPENDKLCGGGGHSALSKGKEPMCEDERILSTKSLELIHVSDCGSHHCEVQEEIVAESLDNGSLRFDHGAALLIPREEPCLSFQSEGSGRTLSECYGSPLSDIYEDVWKSSSPRATTISLP